MTSQSIDIHRGEKEQIGLTFTVPFPCVYKSVQSNEIDEDSCPLEIDIVIPKEKGGTCESRLASETRCGTKFKARSWNTTKFITIIHQDTGNYKLTLAEAEKKIHLKTYDFRSKPWSHVALPVVNVIMILKNMALKLNNYMNKKSQNFETILPLSRKKVKLYYRR